MNDYHSADEIAILPSIKAIHTYYKLQSCRIRPHCVAVAVATSMALRDSCLFQI